MKTNTQNLHLHKNRVNEANFNLTMSKEHVIIRISKYSYLTALTNPPTLVKECLTVELGLTREHPSEFFAWKTVIILVALQVFQKLSLE